MKREKYDVWMGTINYENKTIGKEVIATFYSRNRAEQYLIACQKDNYPNTIYGLDIKGGKRS